jgi:hypothetical protein
MNPFLKLFVGVSVAACIDLAFILILYACTTGVPRFTFLQLLFPLSTMVIAFVPDDMW